MELLMVSCRQMVKTLLKEKEAMIVQLHPAVGNCDVSDSPLELEELLGKYSELFASPTTLPPVRQHDHQIVLALGTALINVRPYRYPHF